jgi:hypothetical protein
MWIMNEATEKPAVEAEAPKTAPILNVAWVRVAALDAMSKKRSAGHYRVRRWIGFLSVLATFLAIVIDMLERSGLFQQSGSIGPVSGLILKVLFVTTPVLASIIAAVASKKYSNGDWLITRAGAEEIQKEIYFYRTVLQKKKSRRSYLEKRLAEIQRQIYSGLNGEFSFETYNGPIPPNYYADDPTSDPGFADLTGEDYFKYRLENQLAWHNKEINEYKTERDRLTILILIAGGLGTVFAAWGQVGGIGLSIWVALTASITAALIGWQELRNIDVIVRNYSKVVLELTVLYDHWMNLEPEERTNAEFYKMVRGCEDVLWAQNTEYIRSMQKVLMDNTLDAEASLVNRVIDESVESAKRTKQAIRDNAVQYTQETLGAMEEKVDETFQAVLGSLAEEASSELVQQELEAMSRTVTQTVENVMERASAFTSSLTQIQEEYEHVEIGRDTPKDELNALLARYPKTNDVKG